MDENQNKEQPNEEEIKKAEEQEAGRKTAHTAGKAAATYFGGAAGNKIYDLASKTKLGRGIENAAGKVIQHSPAKHLANVANKTGALDVADKGIDAASGDMKGSLAQGGAKQGQEAIAKEGGLPKETLAREGLTEKQKNSNTTEGSNTKSDSKEDSSGKNSGDGSASGTILKNFSKVSMILTGLLPCGCIFGFAALTIFIPIIVILAPSMGVINFFAGIFDNVHSEEALAKAEQEYYEALEEAQENAYQKYGVCIDVNLIHATLTVNKMSDVSLEEGEELCEDLEGCSSEAQDLFSVSEYKKMEKQIDLLANMQIKRQKYSLMKAECYPDTAIDRCAEGHGAAEKILVNEENKDCIDEDFLSSIDATLSGLPTRDSSSPRLVARNDKENTLFTSFLVKQATKEKNYEYYLYIPEAKYEDRDEDGVAETRVCDAQHLNNSVPDSYNDFAKLDIGDWENMTDSVYFYNLLDSFVEDYYSEYLTKGSGYAEEGTQRYEDAKDLIDDIYALYDMMGPNQTCTTTGQYICRSDGGSENFSGSRDEFLKSIANIVIEDMNRSGILASLTMAQAAVESANGSSLLSREYSNYYGMTAGSCAPARRADTTITVVYPGTGGNSCSGNAYWDGTVVWMCNSSGKDCQWYRVYDSFANSTADHSRLLSNSNYQCQGITTPEEAIACVQAGGYATASHYQSTIMSVINTYNLTQYDIGVWDGTVADGTGEALYEICEGITNGSGTISSGGSFTSGVCGPNNSVNDPDGFWSTHNIFKSPQCTWYAHGRALQILTNAGMSLDAAKSNLRPMHGDAGEWYDQNENFSSSMNVNEPRQGAIIVWQQADYWGHVAVIEKVNTDANGNPVSVDISEGNNQGRQCTTRTVTMDYVKRHSGGRRGVDYTFKGYIYLLQ